MSAALLVACFALAAVDAPPIAEDAPTPRAVSLMPLRPSDGVTAKQAQGITVGVREALAALQQEAVIKLLPATRDDDKAVRTCGGDVGCLKDLAEARGADRLVFGVVGVGDGALRLTLSVTAREGATPLATDPDAKEVAITADDAARARALDRATRELLVPETLRGTLSISGQAGDVVYVDGRRQGALGDDGALELPRVREGRHTVVVRRPEGNNGALYEPFERDVTVTHTETSALRVTLLPKDGTAALDDAPTASGPPLLAIVGVASGAGILAAGGVVGTLSLLDALAVEERAAQQQLVFPRDEGLVSAGRTKSVVANVLYGVGVVVAGAGVAAWALAPGTAPAEEAPP